MNSKQTNPNDKEPTKFQANNKYFTIAVYAVIVILAGVIIFRLFSNWNETTQSFKEISNTLMPFIIGALIAFILNPAMMKICNLLEKYGRIKSVRIRKFLSIFITYLLVIGLIVVVLFGVFPQLTESLIELLNYIPNALNYVYNFVDNLQEYFPYIDMDILRDSINNTIPDLINYVKDFAANLVPALYTISMSIVNWILNLLISIIVSLYMLADKKPLKNTMKAIIYGFVPVKHIDSFIEILHEAYRLFSSFIIGQSIDSLLVGILCFIFMTIFQMEYAMLISVIVIFTNMIPYFGPFIGAIPGILIQLMISPVKALIFAILILVLQQFDGLILNPKILGSSTGLKPLWIIIAITFGGSIAGVLGMFLGVPVVAFLRYLFHRILNHRLQKRGMLQADGFDIE